MSRCPTSSCFVVCVTNDGYEASLVVRKIYAVMPDAEGATKGLLRVVDESGEDYLFPEGLFAGIDLAPEVRHRLAL